MPPNPPPRMRMRRGAVMARSLASGERVRSLAGGSDTLVIPAASMPSGWLPFQPPPAFPVSTTRSARCYVSPLPGGSSGPLNVTDQAERRQSLPDDAALRAIVEGVEAETGDEFFASLVRHLSSALNVQYAFVSEITPDRQSFRTLALWGRGALRDNLTVPLAGTPCEAVLNGQAAHHPEHLQALFPQDRGLVDWGA